MASLRHDTLLLDYKPRSKPRDLSRWGMVGCWLLSGGFFLLDIPVALLLMLMLFMGQVALAIVVAIGASWIGWAGLVFMRAAVDIRDGFRRDVIPAIYLLIILLSALAIAGTVSLFGQVSGAALLHDWFDIAISGIFMMILTLPGAVLLSILLVITRRRKIIA